MFRMRNGTAKSSFRLPLGDGDATIGQPENLGLGSATHGPGHYRLVTVIGGSGNPDRGALVAVSAALALHVTYTDPSTNECVQSVLVGRQ